MDKPGAEKEPLDFSSGGETHLPQSERCPATSGLRLRVATQLESYLALTACPEAAQLLSCLQIYLASGVRLSTVKEGTNYKFVKRRVEGKPKR